MTIRVNREPDGSFTVSCGSETITVGVPAHTNPANDGRGVIRWPDAPEGSPHGVHAYLAVDPGWLPYKRIRGVFRINVSLEDLADTDGGLRDLENWLRGKRDVSLVKPLVVQVTMPPGKSIDIASLMSRLNSLAKGSRINIVVYIEADTTGVTGSAV
jgi:hypothetical protein